MILLIDNYDSFTFNLQRYLTQLGQEVVVLRNDSPRLASLLSDSFSAILISPGPRAPQDAGYCIEVVRRESGRLPILGVCLGHQVIYEAFGGRILRALAPVHGKSCKVDFEPSRLFVGIESGTPFARYHSLIADSVTIPGWLSVTAWSPEGEIMAIEHKEHLTFGVQFHPESILSLAGHQLLSNFLSCAGLHRNMTLPNSDLLDTTQSQYDFSELDSHAGRMEPEELAVVLPKLFKRD